MKKKLIAAAISAAIAGTAGTANAVNVNPDGLGQVLLYPYYTVQNGNDTLMSVVNTTDQVKAVKVRYLEGKNSREVLDFNLYLSPFDVWTAAITRTEDGAMLTTADRSCTVPAIPAGGVAFRNFEFSGVNADGEDESLARTREGHIEIIEMGVVLDEAVDFTPATWATHVDGTPINCAGLVAAWAPGGRWSATANRAIEPATGGLFGGGLIVNVSEGTDVSYNATALDGFRVDTVPVHTAPGSLLPSLAQADPPISFVFNGIDVTETEWFEGRDAVSAVLMHDTLMNEFVVEAATAAGTDWVISFPTKSFYVQRTAVNLAQGRALPPFTAVFGGIGPEPVPGGACEEVQLSLWDREERTTVDDVDFSPLPPIGRNVLCWETNVITFNDTDVLGSENLRNNINTTFESGWMRISFTGVNFTDDNVDGDMYFGLPAIGFAVHSYANGDVGGLLSNYGNLFDHRATRSIIEGGVE